MEWEPKREDKRNGNVVCFAWAGMESIVLAGPKANEKKIKVFFSLVGCGVGALSGDWAWGV